MWCQQTGTNKRRKSENSPRGPVAKILPSSAQGVGLIPGRGANFPHASQPKNQTPKTEAGLSLGVSPPSCLEGVLSFVC